MEGDEGAGGGGGVLNTGYFRILKICWEKNPKFVQYLIGAGRVLDLTLYYNYAFGCSLKKKLLNFKGNDNS